jgi:hypothetical protein
VSGGGVARAFDKTANQFALGLAQTRFSYKNKSSEMVIDLVFGPNAALGNFGNVPLLTGYQSPIAGGGAAYSTAPYLTSMAIKQAYFSYNITEKLSFTIGQFGTHIGYEVIDAPVNFNYTLSNLFNNGPFYHVGAKVNYAISDNMGVMVGVVNNWDNLYDYKTQKSAVAQYFISPIEGFNLYLNWIGGYGDDSFLQPKVAGGAYNYTRNLFDLTTGYQINDKLYVGLNAAYGFYSFNPSDQAGDLDYSDSISTRYGSTSPNWYGAALYANYTINDMFAVGLRAEHFNDKNGVRYLQAVNNAITLTTPITLSDGHVIIKPEFRFDSADKALYISEDGLGSKTQATFGVAFIYKY